jgi:hypothetical protein
MNPDWCRLCPWRPCPAPPFRSSALGKAGHGRVQWQHSYVSQGKTFCIYLAESEDAIREHASHGG